MLHLRLQGRYKSEKGDDGQISRKVGREPFYVRWDRTKPISYNFASMVPFDTRQKIRSSISLWEERTCIRFVENGPSVDRIEFFDGGGCSSFVGRTGGTQVITV